MAPVIKKKVAPASKASKAKAAPTSHTYVVDFTSPANDKIFDGAAYEKFLVDSLKVEGKTGQLGGNVEIAREGEGKLSITSKVPMSKRYIKYLTKKFLKKHQMREWLRVVATDKNTYTLRFYNVAFDGADEDEETEE